MLLISPGGVDLLLQHIDLAFQLSPQEVRIHELCPRFLYALVQFLYLALNLIVFFLNMLIFL